MHIKYITKQSSIFKTTLFSQAFFLTAHQFLEQSQTELKYSRKVIFKNQKF